jgi:hypothetical protein
MTVMARVPVIPILLSLLPFFWTAPAVHAQEPAVTSEIRGIAEDFGFLITVDVVNNRYTGMQDLFIEPARGSTYGSEDFLHAVCAAVAQVTAHSPAYQTYLDMVMIEVNGELWAISTENCRRAFRMSTEPAQKVLLGRSLQRLR